ncbi:MAG: DUF4160 domain-containing protein [Selenomonadaceae bacterium]|jgi:hypothetical protein|nr:DUF4160 domain-containing protein [Selenomonadaceae bacterium]MDD6119338.1 DUF4160 domain-containing protein [Selenomonadaceae bacterium]MDD7055211.1 DUF4160 domain-containing protein [Selenomonadaceae bacterium]MDY3916693.1 DUF4160 domain-containing protein [Selenomonadaceae bacterium]
MPEAIESYLGYYIFFWIGDGMEPVHVHVAKEQQPNATKFWITTETVELAKDTGTVERKDMGKILRYLRRNRQQIMARWLSRFGSADLKR